MSETLTLTNLRPLYDALAQNLAPSMPKIYEQSITVRGENVSQLAVYAQSYADAESQYILDTLATEGLFQSADDDVLALWDAYCRNQGWLEVDGEHFFPSARIDFPDFRASTDLEPVPAPPSITAEQVAMIAVATADRIIEGLKPPTGDLVIQRDSAGAVVGVRRSRAQD
jgi:hypothetical protein